MKCLKLVATLSSNTWNQEYVKYTISSLLSHGVGKSKISVTRQNVTEEQKEKSVRVRK